LIGIVLAMTHRQKGRDPMDSREVRVSWNLRPHKEGRRGMFMACQIRNRSQAGQAEDQPK